MADRDPGLHAHSCKRLNQIEIYFSVVQRKVLTPGDFADLAALQAALLGFRDQYETAARPPEATSCSAC
jgi:hypothetical protein